MTDVYHQMLYDKLHTACPTLCIGLYDTEFNLRGGDVCAPRRISPHPGIVRGEDHAFSCCHRIFEDWTLWFSGCGMDDEQILRICALAESIQALILRKQRLSNSALGRQDKFSALLNRLLTLSTAEDAAYTAMSALNMGFELTLPRVICLFRLPDSADGGTEMPLRAALHVIQRQGATQSQDLFGSLSGNQIVLCKYLPDYPKTEIKRQIMPILNAVCTTLMELYHMSVSVVIGEVCQSISDYSSSYLDIRRLLRCIELIGGNSAFYFTSEYQLLLGLLQLPSEQLDHFLYEKEQLLEHAPALMETVGMLLHYDMDVSAAADALFVHRNTVIFRLNRLKHLLEIDPLHRDSDRALLTLVYLHARLRPLFSIQGVNAQ
ncbi:MAG: helix-turn-helix domain-containing protein [Christensenellales bacterium]|nr:helix-turn-helix domain-containing protein [Christensenellales bacterium]